MDLNTNKCYRANEDTTVHETWAHRLKRQRPAGGPKINTQATEPAVLQGTPGAKQRAEAENQQAGIKASSVEGRPRSKAAGRDQKPTCRH